MKNKIAEIDLAKLLDIKDQNEYKFHPAVKDKKKTKPLDVFTDDKRKAGEVDSGWWGWQAWYEHRDRWKGCKYILSFMQFHPDGKDVWLFGGIFEKKSLKRPPGGKQGHFYDVLLTEKGQEYIGRLTITYHNVHKLMYRNLEKNYSDLNDSKIQTLEEPYQVHI